MDERADKIEGGGSARALRWPSRHNVIGVKVSATSYDDALRCVVEAARERRSSCVTHLAVHGLVTGSQDRGFRAVLDEIDIVAPDGQPVRTALNRLYGAGLRDRCYGPEFMLRVCDEMARQSIGVYLYGSYPHVVDSLGKFLSDRNPALHIVGCEPSVFRPLTREEDEALVNRINNSGAGVVFVGLGCPLQERFACEHKGRIRAVQICVGAAFDFFSGNKKMAPRWMQRASLEWLYRLLQEPQRLWRRYLLTNSVFLYRVLSQIRFGVQW